MLDQNLSPNLVARLANVYPDSLHVRDLGMERADDMAVWERAREDEFTIVSKDADFHQLSFVRGAPPKVIWIQLGNCTTDEIEALLRARLDEVLAFGDDPEAAFLALR